jgi:hypothetical protein
MSNYWRTTCRDKLQMRTPLETLRHAGSQLNTRIARPHHNHLSHPRLLLQPLQLPLHLDIGADNLLSRA